MNANFYPYFSLSGSQKFRARLFGFPRDTCDIMKYHRRIFFHREAPLMRRVSLTFDISFTAHSFYGMRLASVVVFRGQGSYLYASRLYVSPVTMPIYLASSLPLSCEISYSSLMQISRGGSLPR